MGLIHTLCSANYSPSKKRKKMEKRKTSTRQRVDPTSIFELPQQF
ncbi:unnamed protein product, partial [Musa banksii]